MLIGHYLILTDSLFSISKASDRGIGIYKQLSLSGDDSSYYSRFISKISMKVIWKGGSMQISDGINHSLLSHRINKLSETIAQNHRYSGTLSESLVSNIYCPKTEQNRLQVLVEARTIPGSGPYSSDIAEVLYRSSIITCSRQGE
jgi:hypothetical protein